MEIPQKTKNRAGNMAQAIECLPSKHETPSSNPSTAKTNKQTKNSLPPTKN
jgi:hypothetical protein